ncbi:TPA: hypothetical protein QB482_002102 [Pasteurella multocida]|uniref:hypothetical protein n=1 Tax=Pasteurella multocida TaxID=747 RepID=UPI00074425B3|nr:hypothetical protein [Pasteurella multocida]KUM15308.1 hypothetical protein ASV60_10120 [Pasteurella multocida]MCL7759455.1 hypothetical protein [Pasteurella multocida]MCL7819267.1 hypothetical protein [Pasteurella multocida]NMK15860.1 hypothetical protein [Pasteurella multocida]QHZ97114.1 hypothetical protein GV127_02340 [Pasteurella multocida]
MKKLLLFSLLLLLNGCLYSFEEECFRPLIQVGSSACHKNKGDIFPSISRYQKPYSLGKTNSEQRWKDVMFCGGKYGDYKLENIKTVEQSDKLYHCMTQKGYIHLTPAECGYQNPKWDKGVCNL